MPGSGKAVTMVPVRIIFWTLFSVISAVTIYIFLSLMSGGVNTPFVLQNCFFGEAHVLNAHCSGYARKCYHVCFANTGMKCY